MTVTADLYALLPAVHRARDEEQGGILKALLAVLAGEADVVGRDIEELYDNWFIETCDPWVVPYIGDLLRVQTLATPEHVRGPRLPTLPVTFSQRAYVANTIAYRRRKGTVAVLEQLAHDLTGWRARAVEFFQLLGTTQYLNHVRPFNVRTPDLRRSASLELLGGPFDGVARTAEVRPIELPPAPGRAEIDRGRYNIPNLGLYLWRLQSYPVGIFQDQEAPGEVPKWIGTARLVTAPAEAGYTFSPLGLDAPLFNTPRTETELSHLAEEVDVPGALRPRALHDELEARRQAIVDQKAHVPTFFTDERPALRVFVPTAAEPEHEVEPDRIVVCDLSQWGRPPATKDYVPTGGVGSQSLPIEVAVDPALGRLTLAEGVAPAAGLPVRVAYGYGFSGDLGGGPYDRRDAASLWLDGTGITWQRGVTQDQATHDAAADPTQLVSTLQDAVAAWNAHVQTSPDAFGVVAVMDSATYTGDLTGALAIDIPAGARLAIVAAGWPGRVTQGPPVVVERAVGDLATDHPVRPHMEGDISVRGTASAGTSNPGALIVHGLLIEGRLTVLAGNLGALRLLDCTLVPNQGGLAVNASVDPGQGNGRLRISIDRSICGPISLPDRVPELHVGDGIVDGATGVAVAAPGAELDVQRVTVFGRTEARVIQADSSIFTEPVAVDRLQAGCIRFSYVPDDPLTSTPRRYRCQPDLGLAGVEDPAGRDRRRAELVPAFTSAEYGRPGYAQLGLGCASEIRTGAEDGSEMGAFSTLMQPQREANLRSGLEEYLRSGLEAGTFYVT